MLNIDKELQQAVTALQEELDEVRLITDIARSSKDMMWMTDRQHRFIYISPAVEDILGYSVDESLGKSLLASSDTTDQASLEQMLASLDEAAAHERWDELRAVDLPTREMTLLHRDGEQVATETSIVLRFDESNRFEGMFGISRDIRERKALERDLARSEKLLRKIFDTTPEAVSLMDTTTDTYLDVNTGFEALTGWARDQVIGRTPAELNLWWDLNERNELAAIVEQHGQIRNFEASFRRKDGRRVVGLLSLSVFQIEGRVYNLGSSRDITALREAEAEKKAVEQQLLQAQRMESLGTLAGGIAHNFNNLLMAIQGNASLLELELGNRERSLEYLRRIDSLIDDAAGLTSQLLAFSQPGHANQETFLISDLISEQVTMFGQTYPGVTIQLEDKARQAAVKGNANQISQALLNLLLNARDAMAGGGNIAVRLEMADVSEIDAARWGIDSGSYITLSVRDDGPGMSPEIQDRVFEPFFSTKPTGRGTGLGLASVHSIVSSHGGRITIESTPGSGATFHMLLPSTQYFSEETTDGHAAVSSGTETILIVDDDVNVLNATSMLLQSMGHKTLEATAGTEAVSLLQANPEISVAILDMIMPGMDGVETSHAIRSIKPDIKVLLSSGFHERDNQKLKSDFDGFLNKPFRREELAAAISELRKTPP